MIEPTKLEFAELITIGDEIISGHTIDTNAVFIARQLADLGVAVRYRSSVGDSLEDMESAIRTALGRVSLVITTGGLGPTDDDMTKRALVKIFRRNLVFHEEVWDEIQARYERRGMKISAANQNQGLLPQGAHLFKNMIGSAVGLGLEEDGKLLIALPGVPREMKHILTEEIIPYLKSLRADQAISVKLIRTTGIGETGLAELLAPAIKLEPGVKLAYLPSVSGASLRIVSRGENENAARTKSESLLRIIENEVGKYIYGYDGDNLESTVGRLLIDNDKKLAVAESCSGGQLGMILTSVSGSSGYFLGGILSYSNEAKIEQLGVEPSLFDMDGPGAVSEECAKQMADGCRKRFNSDYALSITGIAGPEGGSEEKPVGTTFIGLAARNELLARKFIYGSDRETNRSRAVFSALEMLRRNILDIG